MKYLTALALLLSGCCGPVAPEAAFVKAAEAYHDVVGVALIPLTDNDPSNDPDLSGVNGEALRQAHEAYSLTIRAAKDAQRDR